MLFLGYCLPPYSLFHSNETRSAYIVLVAHMLRWTSFRCDFRQVHAVLTLQSHCTHNIYGPDFIIYIKWAHFTTSYHLFALGIKAFGSYRFGLCTWCLPALKVLKINVCAEPYSLEVPLPRREGFTVTEHQLLEIILNQTREPNLLFVDRLDLDGTEVLDGVELCPGSFVGGESGTIDGVERREAWIAWFSSLHR